MTARDRYSNIDGYGLINANRTVSQALGRTEFAEVPWFGTADDWGVNMVQAPEVWNAGYTGAGTIVAVLDTGIDYTHHDIDDNIWINTDEVFGNGIDDDGNGYIDDVIGWDFADSDFDPWDDHGHGTAVAGVIAAENNGWGPTGVAFDAQVMPVRVLDSAGRGSFTGIAAGIYYAVNNGAHVINASLGGGFSQEIADAVEYAFSQGVTVVMAAGNDAGSTPAYPAALADQWGIAVGAVDSAGRMASFSNRAGEDVLDYVTAPGHNVVSLQPFGRTTTVSGTSFAAPHVAGLAALLVDASPNRGADFYEDTITGAAASGSAFTLRDAALHSANFPTHDGASRSISRSLTSPGKITAAVYDTAEAHMDSEPESFNRLPGDTFRPQQLAVFDSVFESERDLLGILSLI